MRRTRTSTPTDPPLLKPGEPVARGTLAIDPENAAGVPGEQLKSCSGTMTAIAEPHVHPQIHPKSHMT